MSAPSSSRRSRRRAVSVHGKVYRDIKYTPQFAVGVMCTDERDQRRTFRSIKAAHPGKELKVLVI